MRMVSLLASALFLSLSSSGICLKLQRQLQADHDSLLSLPSIDDLRKTASELREVFVNARIATTGKADTKKGDVHFQEIKMNYEQWCIAVLQPLTRTVRDGRVTIEGPSTAKAMKVALFREFEQRKTVEEIVNSRLENFDAYCGDAKKSSPECEIISGFLGKTNLQSFEGCWTNLLDEEGERDKAENFLKDLHNLAMAEAGKLPPAPVEKKKQSSNIAAKLAKTVVKTVNKAFKPKGSKTSAPKKSNEDVWATLETDFHQFIRERS